LKCYIKPNRTGPRHWTARAAARAVCAALAAGYSPSELRAEFAECVPCAEDKRKKAAQQAAQAALAASNQTLAIADGALIAFELISRWVGRVARFVPAARPAGIALGLVERSLGTVRGEILARRAANDAVIAILRLAA
jgi:hypothetical protein